MTKFERVLSKSDEQLIIDELGLHKLLAAVGRHIIQPTEQAVLAKLTEQQEPAAWLHEETGDVISSELKDYEPEMLKGYGTPLYRCPDFSCKVNLDSSSHIADMRKMVFDPDAALTLAERTLNIEITEPLADELVRFARKLHEKYTGDK